MADGIQVVGLALVTFPLVIEVADRCAAYNIGRVGKALCESLRNQEQIFINSTECLLIGVVTATELHDLLQGSSLNLWSDGDLGQQVMNRLHANITSLLTAANIIYRTIEALRKELTRSLSSLVSDTSTLVARVKKLINSFVHGPQHKLSLERLRASVTEYRLSIEDETSRSVGLPRQGQRIPNLDLVRSSATWLYAALSKVQPRRSTDCQPVHMLLALRGLSHQHMSHNANLEYRFLLAKDAQSAYPTDWVLVNVSPTISRPNTYDSIQQEDSHSMRISALRLIEHTTPPDETILLTRKRVSFRNNKAESALTTTGSLMSENSIDNLCAIFSNHIDNTTPIETSSPLRAGVSGEPFEFMIASGQSNDALSRRFSASLADALHQPDGLLKGSSDAGPPKLSAKARIRLALSLAWATLQLHSTGWLPDGWTKDNILLIHDPPNDPRPCISHYFGPSNPELTAYAELPDATMPPPLTSGRTNTSSFLPVNRSLFALGVLLLELCYNRNIEDMASDSEKGDAQQSTEFTVLLTAMRLSTEVEGHLGFQYQSAVKACLEMHQYLDPHESDTQQFDRRIFESVIRPLEDVVNAVGPP